MIFHILNVAVKGVEVGWVRIQNWLYCFYGERLNKICGTDCTLHQNKQHLLQKQPNGTDKHDKATEV